MTSPAKLEHLKYLCLALDNALTFGVERWAEDTDGRKAWLEEGELAWHTIAGTMLAGMFSYVEGTVGLRWWGRLNSAAAKRDFPILWIARNAYVHNDGVVEVSAHLTAQRVTQFETYCADLDAGEILDDLEHVYPIYMTLDGSNLRFNRDAMHVFKTLFVNAFRADQAGHL